MPLIVRVVSMFFFFQAEDGIRDLTVTGVQTCALPIFPADAPGIRGVQVGEQLGEGALARAVLADQRHDPSRLDRQGHVLERSEEHTSELQSQSNLVCRLLLEKKNMQV